MLLDQKESPSSVTLLIHLIRLPLEDLPFCKLVIIIRPGVDSADLQTKQASIGVITLKALAGFTDSLANAHVDLWLDRERCYRLRLGSWDNVLDRVKYGGA